MTPIAHLLEAATLHIPEIGHTESNSGTRQILSFFGVVDSNCTPFRSCNTHIPEIRHTELNSGTKQILSFFRVTDNKKSHGSPQHETPLIFQSHRQQEISWITAARNPSPPWIEILYLQSQ
jgi:hypothetical protein